MQEFEARVMAGGKVVTDRISAASEADARRMLAAAGRQVLALRVKGGAKLAVKRGEKFELTLFVQELVALLDAGLTLTEALEILRDKEDRTLSRQLFSQLLERMYQGQPLSSALGAMPGRFPELFVAAVSSSEHTGQLPDALRRYLSYEARIAALKKQVTGALVYPLLVLIIGAVILLFMLFYVIPRFAEMLASSGDRLPASARLMVDWSELVAAHGWTIGVGMAASAAVLAWLLVQPASRDAMLSVLWRIPRVGETRRLFMLARFYRSLGLVLAGGMPVVQGLTLAGSLLGRSEKQGLARVLAELRAGQPLSQTLARHQLTTVVAERLLRVGEHGGELPQMCERIALFYDEAIGRAVDLFGKVFGPIVMLGVGALVGGVVILLYLPIFELAGGAGS
ncbi:type II secretion system F family protein [Crenobacter cavernae]|uniref:Type II secretion system F family protein n=1 Tax=Crenobacter cavernae TaxID=2290923 RepID=A0ABY0FB92_9NEIS|nr:type II secretion system F family protein [Crenobacter cavernae]RXZ43213.1 type II secretion system F family protein [Crenobacter cavernae]